MAYEHLLIFGSFMAVGWFLFICFWPRMMLYAYKRAILVQGGGDGTLDRMIAAGLVIKSDTRDPRRVYYKLTALGQTAMKAESDRLSAVAAIARRHLKAT